MTVTFAQPPSTSGLDGHAATICDDLTGLVKTAAATDPRKLQRQIGPSEIGHPCLRHLAYKTLDLPACNTDQDPLPSAIGTGAHSWLSEAVARCGNGRYLANLRVQVSGQISGELDLLDTWTRTVIDAKFPGPSGIKRCRVEGPGRAYRSQVHLYGLGLYNVGYTPAHVAIVFFPRAGRLDFTHVWSEPWNQQLAENDLNRLATLAALLGALDAETRPGPALAQIPMTPTFCGYCPWFRLGSTDLAEGCPGDGK